MIPDDVRQEALKLIDAGWPKAALAIIDAAWPQTDARLREAAQAMVTVVTFAGPPVEFGEGNPCWEARVPIAFVDNLLAALAPPMTAAPPPPVAPGRAVPVRVAVAMNAAGNAVTYNIDDYGVSEGAAWTTLASCGYPIRLAILTADLPLPDVPEVRAKVEGVKP